MKNNLSCPVSPERIDENSARITALIITLIITSALVFSSWIIALFAAVDFSLRAFTSGKYSLVRNISKKISGKFNYRKKMVDASPKKFAAGLGLVFSVIVMAFLLLNSFTSAVITASLLIICALLEGLFAVCVGCHIYSWILVPFLKQGEYRSQE